MSDGPQGSETELAPEAELEIERASTLELFLDLVFVYTITQLTDRVAHPHGLQPYGKALLVLMVTWWMYDGYIWMTGNVRLERAVMRIGLFTGMAGFLLMALAIPGAFGEMGTGTSITHDSGIAFGIGFVVVTLVHIAMFTQAPNTSASAIWRIAPFNLGGAILVLAAGFVTPDWRWVCWLAAVLATTGSGVAGRHRGWSISSAHFVERHGLLIIVALGESVVAIGVGAAGRRIDVSLVIASLFGLALNGAMWWVYFDRDDANAERVLTGTGRDRRSRLALWVAYCHLVMIAGIIMAAAGVTLVVAHPSYEASTAVAWNLGGGIAIYLVGEAAFRARVDLHWSTTYIVAGLALTTVPIGLRINGIAQLIVLVALMVGLVGLRAPASRRAPEAAAADE